MKSLDYHGKTVEQSDNDDKMFTNLKPCSQIVDLFYGIEEFYCCYANKVFYDMIFYATSEINQKNPCIYCNYYHQKYFIKLPKYLVMIFNKDNSEIPKKIEKKMRKNQIASIKYFISQKIHKF